MRLPGKRHTLERGTHGSRNSMNDKLTDLSGLVENSRLEILPTKTILDDVQANVPTSRRVTVTASPTKGLEPTLAMTEQLCGLGYRAVPHVAARMVGGRGELDEIVARLREAGVDSVFVPGGDAEQAPGGYPDALALLEDLDRMGRPFNEIGIAGYPESHPTIDDAAMAAAMAAKSRYATEIVSNLCLRGGAVKAWIRQVRKSGIDLPIRVGMPGSVERRKLLAMAARIGVGESTRFASKNVRLFARILSPGGFGPAAFLHPVESAMRAGHNISGLHIYTFNQVTGIEPWMAHLPAARTGRIRGIK